MPRKRTKRSVFCEKRPATGLVDGIVYFKAENIWRICKGKLYKNGYFRYYHNGQTAVVGPRNYKFSPDWSFKDIEAETQRNNLQLLEWKHPRRFRFHWREVLEEPAAAPETPRVRAAINVAADVLTNAGVPVNTPPDQIPNLLTPEDRTRLLEMLNDVPLDGENG